MAAEESINTSDSFFMETHCVDMLGAYNRMHDYNFTIKSFNLQLLNEIPPSATIYYKLYCTCNRNDSEVRRPHNVPPPIQEALLGPNRLTSSTSSAIILAGNTNEPKHPMDPDRYVDLSFIIKKAPYDDQYDNRQHAFVRDARIHWHLVPLLCSISLEQWAPKNILKRSNFIVMEDILQMGFEPLCLHSDNLKDMQILPILKSLAYMHTSSLIYETKRNISIPENFSQHFGTSPIVMQNPWFAVGIKALVEMAKIHPKYNTDAEKHFLNTNLLESLQSVCSMVEPSKVYRNALLHRSFWEGHVYLNSSSPGTAAIFAEYHNCTYAPPAIDVIYTMYMNITPEQQAEKEQFYLSYYFDHFRMNLSYNDICEDAVDLREKDFRRSYDEFRLLGMVYRALNATIVLVPQDVVDDVYKYQNRCSKLFECMYNDRNLRETLLTYIEQIVDTVMPEFCTNIDNKPSFLTTSGL